MSIEHDAQTALLRGVDNLVHERKPAEAGEIRVHVHVDAIRHAAGIEELTAEWQPQHVVTERLDLIEHRAERAVPQAVRRVVRRFHAEPVDACQADLFALRVHDLAAVGMQVTRRAGDHLACVRRRHRGVGARHARVAAFGVSRHRLRVGGRARRAGVRVGRLARSSDAGACAGRAGSAAARAGLRAPAGTGLGNACGATDGRITRPAAKVPLRSPRDPPFSPAAPRCSARAAVRSCPPPIA
jgi:hypothetical protein